MMNMIRFRGLIFLFTAWLFCFSASAIALPWAIEGKAGAFFPESKRISKIFNTAMPYVEVEGSYRFSPYWDGWGSVGCIFGQGRSIGCKNRTTLQVIPFALGARRFFPLTERLDLFCGVGGLISIYRNKDHSSFVHKQINEGGFGAVVRGGVQYLLLDKIFLNLSLDYMFQRFTFYRVYRKHFTYRNSVNMNGLKLGFGVTYDF